MSGVVIKTTGTTEPTDAAYISVPVSFSNYELYLCPTSYTGSALDTTKVVRNFAKDKNDATLIGNPTITSNYTSVSAGNGFQTDVADSADFTMFVIARSTDTNAASATRPFFIGTSNGAVVGGTAAVYGTALIVGSITGFSFQCARGNSTADQVTGTVSISSATPNNWNLIWVRSSGLKTKLRSETANVEAETTFTLPRLLQQNKVKIGTNSTASNGKGDIFRAVVFNRALTDDEISKVVVQLKAHATARGITV